jgi:hypothetical protein
MPDRRKQDFDTLKYSPLIASMEIEKTSTPNQASAVPDSGSVGRPKVSSQTTSPNLGRKASVNAAGKSLQQVECRNAGCKARRGIVTEANRPLGQTKLFVTNALRVFT